jgi:hypothetical protein
LRFLRILPNTNIELNRQIAAARIQRAWRSRHTEFTEIRSEKGEGSQAWSANDANTSLHHNHFSQSNREAKTDPVEDPKNAGKHRILRRRDKKEDPSQIGTKMAVLTGQRVATFLLVSLLLGLVFTYTENDSTDLSTMVMLHGQTTSTDQEYFALKAVYTARHSTLQTLFNYTSTTYKYNTSTSEKYNTTFSLPFENKSQLCAYEIKKITVHNERGKSVGFFDIRKEAQDSATVELLLLAFVLVIWFFGVAGFAGPIMQLVVTPIERAVKLLGQLVMDPLGYQNTLQYKMFLLEADQIATKNPRWSREVFKGMETEFLMSTIDRIGSLMKVGFGSAGVQIIRNNLQKGQSKDTSIILNAKGSMVSCIFLFCDIRSFTDATECLQEEVFVFTNRVAAVVHSICNSYAGSANKNIGDAFLVSWKLDDDSAPTKHQADKALYVCLSNKLCLWLLYYIIFVLNHRFVFFFCMLCFIF